MPEKNQLWIGFARTAVSGVIAAVAVIFFFGARESKINDLVAWKVKAEPTLQRMDTTGTLSFDIFHREYMRTQERQEKRLDDLDKRVRDLERN